MTKRAWLGHVSWAAVAVAAFAVGAARERGGPGREASGDALQSGRSAPGVLGGAGGSETTGHGARPARSGTRPMSGTESGALVAQSQEELEALAQQAFRSGNPLERRDAFGRLLASLTSENATAIRDLLKANKVEGDEWRDFHYAWGTIDGEAAVKYGMESKEYDMAHTMSGWASANPEEARAFLANMPEDIRTDRELLKRSLVAGVADRDPNLATEMVLAMAAQGERRASEYIGTVAGELLRTQGTEEAMRWSEGLPDGAVKGAAMDQVAHAYVERDPVAAAEWAQQFAGESYAGRVIEEVGDEWAKRDPVAAVDWLETLPGGGGQNSGLSSAYRRWASRDAAAAGERLAAMPRSEQRDSAIGGFANGLAYRDPATAIAWANSIAQDNLRNEALTRAGQALFRRDAEAARTWVSTSGLPAEVQEAVLNPPRRR